MTLQLGLKALADNSRLALLRLLNQGELTVKELAERVELTEPTVSHHLAKLREAGFVSLRMAGNQHFYRLHQEGLNRFKKGVNEIEIAPPQPDTTPSDDSWIAALGWDADDQQILRDYTRNGQLTTIPSKQKRLIVVLRWLATLFQPDVSYTEAEINAILKTVYAPDYVTLRRELVDFHHLRRDLDGKKYWRTPAEE